MRLLLATCVLLFTATGLVAQDETPAQDTITLKGGNRLEGTVKSAADGKLVFATPSLGDLTIPMDQIVDLQTVKPLTLQTSAGETLVRRVTGITNGSLQLASGGEGAPAAPSLALSSLTDINPPADASDWAGSLSIGGFLASGNTERRSIAAAVNMSRRTAIDRITLDGAWNYAENKTRANNGSFGDFNLTERRVFGRIKYDYFLNDRTYVWASSSAMGNTLADIDLRWAATGGIGHQWVERDDYAVLTEVGLGYFHESYRSGAPTQENLAARVAMKMMWEVVEGLKLYDDLEAFPSLESSDDIFLYNALYTNIELTDSMFMQPRYEIDYDNTPAPGFERLDHRFFLNIGWGF